MFKFNWLFLIYLIFSFVNQSSLANENERLRKVTTFKNNWEKCVNLYVKIGNDKVLIKQNKEQWQESCFAAKENAEKYFPDSQSLAYIYEILGWYSWQLSGIEKDKSRILESEDYFLKAIKKYEFFRDNNIANNKHGWILAIRSINNQVARLMSKYDIEKSFSYLIKNKKLYLQNKDIKEPLYNETVYYKRNKNYKEVSEIYHFDDLKYLAYLYLEVNKLNKAREIYDDLIPNNNCEKYEFSEDCIIALYNKSLLFEKLGLNQERDEIFNNIIYKIDDYDWNDINSKNYNLSRYCLYLSNGIFLKNEIAEKKFEKNCLTQNPDNLDWNTLITLANFYKDKGKRSIAIDMRNKAKDKLLKTRVRDDIDVILNNMAIAEIHVVAGNYKLATEIFEEEFRLLPQNNNLALSSINRYRMFYFGSILGSAKDEQEIIKNLELVRDAIKNDNNTIIKNAPFFTLEERLNFIQTNAYQEPDNLIFSISRYFPTWGINPNSKKLLTYSVIQEINNINFLARTNRKGLLEEIEKRQNIFLNADDEIIILNQNLKKIYDRLRQEKRINKVKLLKSQKEKLEKKLYKKLPELSLDFITKKDILKALPKNSFLIDFKKYSPYVYNENANAFEFSQKSRYSALVVLPTGKIFEIDLGESSFIDNEIDNLLEKIESGEYYQIHLEKITNLFIEPFKKYFKDYKEVFLSLDSKLNYIPINLLRDKSENNFYHKNLNLRIISSPRELIGLQKKKAINNQNTVFNSVVLANPDFNSSIYQEYKGKENSNIYTKDFKRSGDNCQLKWGSLPNTKSEGIQIKNLLNAKLYSEGDASEETLKSLKLSPSILHIATHGFYCLSENGFDNPLLNSGIVLSGANNQKQNIYNDGYFTALEFTKLDLSNTELVILSSCESALGEDEVGEGIMGLRRSLSVAGAKSSILSLWKVDDDATSEFMRLFYEKLKKGDSRKEALEKTQEEFRNGLVKSQMPGIDWSEEYYWGAFQLSGDWRAFQFNQ